MRSRLPSIWRRNGATLLVVLAVLVLVGLEFAFSVRAQPPRRTADFRSFLEWHTSCDRFAFVPDRQGEEYLIAYGPTSGLLLASGPSAYVFDRDGRLVDRSSDIGDDSAFRQRWPQLPPKHHRTAEDAAAWLNGN